MKKILSVIKREYIQIIRTKGFIIGTVLGPVLMAAFIVVPVVVQFISVDKQEEIGIIDGTGEDFLVYSGNDGDTFHIMALGGYGAISVASHLVGAQIKEMIGKCLSGEVEAAAQLHRRLLPLIDALFVVSNPMPIKYALNYLGFPVGKPRLPLTEPDEKSAAVIRDALKNYSIDLPLASRR